MVSNIKIEDKSGFLLPEENENSLWVFFLILLINFLFIFRF